MDMCHVIARRSTCLRLQTAAILVKNRVVISMGYNGSLSNALHCSDYWEDVDTSSEEFLFNHHNWSVDNELHAECNAITNLSPEISANGATLYCIYSPCSKCAEIIASVGIVEVVYSEFYKRDTTGLEFLKSIGIVCRKFLVN
jgi:dCMP deaminase